MTALSWDGAASAQLAGGVVSAGVFLRISCSPVIRVWGGIGECELAADLVEDDPTGKYLGFGEFAGLPAINQLINGVAERVEFTLSGAWLTSEIAQLAANEAPIIRNAAVNLGFHVLDGDLQPLSPVDWCWEGVADSLTIERRNAGAGQIVRSIKLSVATAMSGRSTPKPSYWADPFQRERSADDSFCARVEGYNLGTTKTWPN